MTIVLKDGTKISHEVHTIRTHDGEYQWPTGRIIVNDTEFVSVGRALKMIERERYVRKDEQN